MRFKFAVFLSLIRSVFPRWDFFDQIAFSFNVYFKMSSDTEWKRLVFDQPHKTSRLVFNPLVNQALAEASLVEHFARDVQEDTNVDNLTSYQLLCSLLRTKLSHEKKYNKDFQFKIVATGESSTVDIYTSRPLSFEHPMVLE